MISKSDGNEPIDLGLLLGPAAQHILALFRDSWALWTARKLISASRASSQSTVSSIICIKKWSLADAQLT
jgi:hypothetical protein